MNPIYASLLFAFTLFAGMLLFLEIGWRFGKRRPHGSGEGFGAVDGAVLALLGLLLAFTFSGAASRFDNRRALIVEETNDIGTAWLRLDLLSPKDQPGLRELFRRYVDCRLEMFTAAAEMGSWKVDMTPCTALQGEIWKKSVEGTREAAMPSAPMLLLPALNAMFDITTTRAAALQIHPPSVIYGMLALVAYISSLLAGFGMSSGKKRSWVHMVGFALITAGTVYLILDLEFPRLGFIRVESFDQVLVDLRKTMN